MQSGGIVVQPDLFRNQSLFTLFLTSARGLPGK